MSKKLLSVLVVLALALSLIPVVGLPATEANAATVDHKKNLVDTNTVDLKMTADCPACGAKNVQWNEFPREVIWTADGTNEPNVTGVTDGDITRFHIYLASDYESPYTSSWALSTSNKTNYEVCFHLNGNKGTFNSGLMVTKTNNTLNIIGGEGGELVYNGTGSGSYFLNANNGNLNIYGGTYTAEGTEEPVINAMGVTKIYDATINGTLRAGYKLKKTTLYGTTTIKLANFAEKPGKLELAQGWSGTIGEYKPFPGDSEYSAFLNETTGLFDAAFLISDGTHTGTVNLADGRKVIWTADGFMAAKAAIVKDNTAVPYADAAAALAAYTAQDFTDGKALKLFLPATLALSGADYYVDACGNDVTVSGTGNLYPMDSANDGYDKKKCGEWTISGVTVVNDVTNGKRYITIKEGSKYSAHRLTLDVTDAVLRTSENGLFFKAEIKADTTLAARIKAYGVTTSKTDAPTAVVEADNAFTKLTDFTPNSKHTVYTNSALIKNIFKEAADANNKTRSETKIYAAAYVSVQLDNAADTTTDLFSAGVSSSAADVLKAIDTKWSSYNAKAQANATAFFAQWKGKGVADGRIEDLGMTNIK